MKVLHIINRQSENGPRLKNLTKSKDEADTYYSGYWDILLEEAKALVGSMLYLHERKQSHPASVVESLA